MFKTTRSKEIKQMTEEIDAQCMEFLMNAKTEKEKIAAIELNEKWIQQKKNFKTKFAISPDTLIVVLGNLLGILLILNFEKLGVVTSKALGFVLRGRV